LFKKFISMVITCSLLCCMPVSAADADWMMEAEAVATEYIIELTSPPVYASPKERGVQLFSQNEADRRAQILAEQEAVLAELTTLGGVQLFSVAARPLEQYTNIFNGFAMTLAPEQAEAARELAGVKNVYVSKTYEAIEPKLLSSTELIAANGVPQVPYDGTGQAVAIIDSGIDTDHEFFSLTDPDSALFTKADMLALETGIDMEKAYQSAKIPFAYDYADADFNLTESKVHGSHVAGIAAGNGPDFSGVAPEAQLLVMKVFAGTTAKDIHILSALDDLPAFPGVCAANLSLGIDYAPAVEALGAGTMTYAEVLHRLGDLGILVNCAAGNSGRGFNEGDIKTSQADYGSQGIPAYYEDAFSVGASVNSTQTLPGFTLADGTVIPFSGNGTSFLDTFSDGEYPYVYAGYGFTENFTEEASGSIVLIDRGGTDPATGSSMTFSKKETNAHAAGAVGVVYLNNAKGYLLPASADLLPVCIVSSEHADIIKNQMKKTLTTDSLPGSVPMERAGKMADFSAWGVDYNLNLKPEITAPGEGIYSSVPDNRYDSMNGTSMAAPHITGATALLNGYLESALPQVTGKDKTLLMQNLMMSTATPLYDKESVLASPRQQGAGQLNLKHAMQAKVVLAGDSGKTKISLGDDITNSFTLSFTAENLFDEAVLYDSVSVQVMAEDYITKNGETYISGMRNLTFAAEGPTSLEISGGETQTLDFTVTLSDDELAAQEKVFENGFFIDGFVTFEDSTASEPALHIPFTGFRGNWEMIPKLEGAFWDAENAVYGRTGLASKVGGSAVYLGRNFYTTAAPQERFAALSPDGDGALDELHIPLMLLSTATELRLKIVGETSTYTKNFVPKYASTTRAYSMQFLQTLADGLYTVRVSAINDYDQNKEADVLDMHFTIDRQKPHITEIREYMEGDKKMLSVKAADNHYIMGIAMSSAENGLVKVPFAAPSEGMTCKAVFDITNLDVSNILAIDYAGNLTQSAEFPAMWTVEKTADASCKISFTGTGEATAEAYAVPAVYDAAGRLVSVGAPTEVTIPAQETEATAYTWTFDETLPDSGNMKLFFWKEADNPAPAFSMPVISRVIEP